MKFLLPFCLMAMLVASSCGNFKSEQKNGLDSLDSTGMTGQIITPTKVKPVNPWVLPTNGIYKDQMIGLIIPRSEDGVPVYSKPGDTKVFGYITDTTLVNPQNAVKAAVQGLCSEAAAGEDYTYYELTTPDNNLHGWVLSRDIMIVDGFGLGVYRVDGRILQGGTMRATNLPDSENYCQPGRAIFFMDNRFLYLIDTRSDSDGNVHFKDDQYLTLLDASANFSLRVAEGHGDNFVIRGGVPNGSMVLVVRFESNHPMFDSFEIMGGESDVDDLRGDSEGETEGEGEGEEDTGGDDPTVYSNEIHNEECTFSDYSIGDCGHMEFSCGDFGNAQRDELSKEDEALWEELVIVNKDGDETGNPKYVGKTFVIKYMVVKGDACGDPSGPQVGPVQYLYSFKLKK